MYQNKGFTLIELLVVVLIIGILSAAALPQYRLAVDKSRFVTYIQLARTFVRAQEAYYMANGQYAVYLEDLDVAPPPQCSFVSGATSALQCPDGFIIDNQLSAPGVTADKLTVALCPGKNHGLCYETDETVAWVSFPYSFQKKQSELYCQAGTGSHNAYGTKLCNALKGLL